MAQVIGTRLQTTLVVLLFLGSLGVLLYSTWTTLALNQRKVDARNQLQAASKELAQEARTLAEKLNGNLDPNDDEVDEQLRKITTKILAEYPGLEGGFFLALRDRFSGYAYPTSKHTENDLRRNEPPPLETPFIRRQAQKTLDSEAFQMRTEDVESSRVVIFTEPVGDAWPTSLTTWLMVRLTGPESLEKQLRHAEIASFLALGGIFFSLILTWNLGRNLRSQRREQERLRDELRHSEHLAGLGKLLAGVAHEIRNPLAAIRSTVQLWQRLPERARTPESLDAVVQSVDRLGAIVTRLLFFSRSDNADRQPLDVNQLLAESLDLIQAQAAGQGVSLQRVFDAKLPLILGSSTALRQVILNLLANAMQAMPRGGDLICATAYLAASHQVEILVSDTGIGVSDADRRHLFEPFFTTRPDGTGLGLALCREIITNHQGTIEYLPREKSGATFRIILSVQ